MVTLETESGALVCSARTGAPFVYSTWDLARAAARVLAKTHGRLKVVPA